MRGAIVGFGIISSTGHTPAYLKMKDHQIIAVVDIVEARRKAAEKMIPGVKTFSSYQDLLAANLPLDFIDIATPPRDHLEIALAGARQKLHVLVEKPITMNIAEARQLLCAARDNQVSIFPCHNYKHAPVVKEMKDAMKSGRIGRVRSATLTTFRTTNAKGTPEFNTDWRREKAYAGGGVVMDHGSHSCYLTFMFFDGKPPVSVSARTYQLDQGYDTEDNVCAVLNFAGGFAQLHLSWTAGVRKVIYALQGSEGAVVVDEDDAQLFSGNKAQRKNIVSKFDDASHTEWFTSMFNQFYTDVQAKNFVTSELKESYWCIATIEAIYKSAASGGVDTPIDTDLNFLNVK